MPAPSLYVFECEICVKRGNVDDEGKPVTVRSHEPEVVCPRCGATLVVENWGKA